MPCHGPVDPSAVIGAAIREGHLAHAIGLSFGELAHIKRSVGIGCLAGARDLSGHPITSVFKAVGQFVGARAILTPVFERAFIDGAIVILFAENLLSAGPRSAQRQRQAQT